MLSQFIYRSNKHILEIIDSNIDSGHTQFADISDQDKKQLAIECMKSSQTSAESAIVDGDDFAIMIHHLKQYMLTGKRDHALDLAETLSKNVTEYFFDDLAEIFEERLEHREVISNINCGLRPHRDRINGELIWR